MTAFLRWILGFIITVAAVLFALANRTIVSVIWSPFHSAMEVPVFLPALASLVLGFMLGGAMVWLNGAERRREQRHQRKQIRKLEQMIEDSEKEPDLTAEPVHLPDRYPL